MALQQVEGFIKTIQERLELKKSIWEQEEDIHDILEKEKLLDDPSQSEIFQTVVLANSILDVFTNVKIHYDKLSRSHPVDFTFFKQYNIKVLRSKERTTVVDLKKPIRDYFYHSFEPTSEEGPSSVSSKEQCIRVLSQSFSLK